MISFARFDKCLLVGVAFVLGMSLTVLMMLEGEKLSTILQTKKLRLRDTKWLTQGHVAN